jgi:hypothetical protein
MKCIEMIVKFINRNAYVYIAVTGKSFCDSAAAATALIVKNMAKVVAINFVAEITLFLSKLIVTGFISIISYMIMVRYPGIFSTPITSRFVIVVNDLFYFSLLSHSRLILLAHSFLKFIKLRLIQFS